MGDVGSTFPLRAADIADLALPVTTLGALRCSERISEDVFESTISLVEIIYELGPR